MSHTIDLATLVDKLDRAEQLTPYQVRHLLVEFSKSGSLSFEADMKYDLDRLGVTTRHLTRVLSAPVVERAEVNKWGECSAIVAKELTGLGTVVVKVTILAAAGRIIVKAVSREER
ncbi:MAG: hypothetical protein HQL38_04960 [Alphaproteobacteria bacterium]|nr:hypothetical protein [Alphaproteobacteria bacterium]MBF0392012.1 hypothetical protein [Alphaproteobacteria bacterium]